MDAQERYLVRLASTVADQAAALRLRYKVFVEEFGAEGPMVDHAAGIERDEFDEFFDQLVLVDRELEEKGSDHVVGVYRLLPSDRLDRAGRFYSESEFDLSVLKASGRRLLELGRSCIHPDHRGGTGMFHLWNGLAEYVLDRDIEVLFGAASLRGTDLSKLEMPLSYLYHHHLAPKDLCVGAVGENAVSINLLPADKVDRRAALADLPPLIKAYIRLGGFVGEGAYVDRAFNTTDVCLVMDTAKMSAKHREFYVKRRGDA